MQESIEKLNISGDEYTVESIYEPLKTDKKANVYYWDGMEHEVEDFLKKFAKNGGVTIKEIGDLDIVKELTEMIIDKIEKRFPEAEFPYVDENF